MHIHTYTHRRIHTNARTQTHIHTHTYTHTHTDTHSHTHTHIHLHTHTHIHTHILTQTHIHTHHTHSHTNTHSHTHIHTHTHSFTHTHTHTHTNTEDGHGASLGRHRGDLWHSPGHREQVRCKDTILLPHKCLGKICRDAILIWSSCSLCCSAFSSHNTGWYWRVMSWKSEPATHCCPCVWLASRIQVYWSVGASVQIALMQGQ